MAITRETISGTTILNEVQSSNIVRTEYEAAIKKWGFTEVNPDLQYRIF